MRLLSEAKVASMCESKGEAARRRRGWEGGMALAFVGEEALGDVAGYGVSGMVGKEFGDREWERTLFVFLGRLVDDGGVL